MSARYLTEPEAWREIARRIVEREWAGYGLFYEAHRLWFARRILIETLITMERRIQENLTMHPKCVLVYPQGKEQEARALAALWLALEAEEEDGQ